MGESGLPPSLTVNVPLAFDAELCRFEENPCGCWGALLVSLKPPFKGLSPNSVASITKRILLAHGVDTSVWGAHSTRGAGVLLYKILGLSSEPVCKLGQWKNV